MMPTRLNRFAPVVRPTAEPEAVAVTAPDPHAIDALAPETPTFRQRRSLPTPLSLARSFSVFGGSRFSQPATGPVPLSTRERKKQLETELDHWATTQNFFARNSITKLKEHLHSGGARTFLRRDNAQQELYLSSYGLTSFPAAMAQAKNLHTLWLEHNQLTSFPAEMAQAERLHMLSLDYNRLSSFPAEMAQSKNLHTLRLNSNRLTSFPAEMRHAKSLHTLWLCDNQLTSFPAEMAQSKRLNGLGLGNNQLTSFPAEMGQSKSLRTLGLNNNQLTSFPAEMGRAKALHTLWLNDNQLTSFPAEMGQAKALHTLHLSNNQLTSFPAEMGQAKALEFLRLEHNQLTDLPNEITHLKQLKHLNLNHNQFAQVPRFLLNLPAYTVIDLLDNPLPEEEIIAVREIMAQRFAAGQTVPQLLLPALPGEAGELREAAANDMNVHTTVLTDAFKKRLDDVARQFPGQLCGSIHAQRLEMAAIAQRLMDALNDHAGTDATDARVLAQARDVAALMFQKGQGTADAYYNEFDRSSGHVLAYTFLALEAQWARTPEAHQAEALRRGVAMLTRALDSGSGMCDTRLCEEVMQVIGLPLSDYAEMHQEVLGIVPPSISVAELRDVTLAVAKKVLQEMLESGPALPGNTPPEAWRPIVTERMQRDHPNLLPEQWEPHVTEIASNWQMFHDLVDEQTSVGR